MSISLQENELGTMLFGSDFDEDDAMVVEYEDESTKIDKEQHSQFLKDTVVYAQSYVEKFFKGKEMYAGGPIPASLLKSDKYLSLVINTSLNNCIPYAYKIMEQEEHPYVFAEYDRDVHCIVEVLQHCKNLGIPKCFAAGLLLMYLEICEGVSLVE